jgi:hypothetical protein
MARDHEGMTTLWINKERLAFLKQVEIAVGVANIDETLREVLEHYKTCPKGLEPKIKEAKKRLEALTGFQV